MMAMTSFNFLMAASCLARVEFLGISHHGLIKKYSHAYISNHSKGSSAAVRVEINTCDNMTAKMWNQTFTLLLQ